MTLKSYLFTLRQSTYTQYPNDHTSSFLASLCRNLKDKHQVVVYRDGGLMYYCYLYQSSRREVIGICIASGELCVKLEPLYDRFVSCLVQFARRGVAFRFDNDGEIACTTDILQNVGEIEELFRWLAEHTGSGKPNWTDLPPQDHSIAKGTSVLFNFSEDDHRDILEATKHYTYVFITMHNPTQTSYSETVKRLSSGNEKLAEEKISMSKQLEKVNKQKKQYELVVGLVLVMFFGALVAIATIATKNEKIQNQSATIQDNNTKINSQRNTISSQKNTIIEQSQSISRLENQVANLESTNKELEATVSTLEDTVSSLNNTISSLKAAKRSILSHNPFTVTYTHFSFESGNLTVYYYAPNGGTKNVRCKVIRESDNAEIFDNSYTLATNTYSGNNFFTLTGLRGLNNSNWYRFEIYADGNFCGGGRH